MFQIIPVLENLLFSACRVVLAGCLAGAEICLSVRVMVGGPVTQAFCWEKIPPGTLGLTRTEWRKEEEPLWGRQIWLSDYLFLFHRKSNVKWSPHTKFDLKCRHEFLQFWINLASKQKEESWASEQWMRVRGWMELVLSYRHETGHQHQHIQPPVSCLLPVLALPVAVALMTRLIQLTSPRTKVFIVPERRADWWYHNITSHRNWALMSPAFIGIEFPPATLTKHVHIADGRYIRYQVWDCLHPWLILVIGCSQSPPPCPVKPNFNRKTPLNFSCFSW